MGVPWPAAATFDANGLRVGGLTSSSLAEEFGTPLVVVDEDHFRARCREFRDAFPGVLWAVKAFPLRELIRIALDEGLGVLAATGGELDACLRAGAPGDRIVLHGNNKLDHEIAAGVEARVRFVILDNGEKIERVAVAARAGGVTQAVLLRIAPGVDVETHAYIKTAAPDTKFGTPVTGGQALEALRLAIEASELDVHGIHLHLGSQLLDGRPYRAGLGAGLDFLAEAKKQLGFRARTMDVGGGMGITYIEENPLPVSELATQIEADLASGCRERHLEPPALLVEPGRAIASGSALTLYRVGSIKHVPDLRTFVAVDGGMSDNIRPALYGSRYTVKLVSRSSDAEPHTVTIAGRHCESGDMLARDVALPGDVRRGDLLAFASTGAYEYSMASNYNKVGRPAVVAVSEGRPRLIARRETYEDLADLDID